MQLWTFGIPIKCIQLPKDGISSLHTADWKENLFLFQVLNLKLNKITFLYLNITVGFHSMPSSNNLVQPCERLVANYKLDKYPVDFRSKKMQIIKWAFTRSCSMILTLPPCQVGEDLKPTCFVLILHAIAPWHTNSFFGHCLL